ncbi:MAG: hypothetical protein HYW33_00015 [Candidatus Blackburnbacteria bacterium]|nr:hypothetical protein [Candidatus Blackburnbacteria bacterium]
MELLKERHGTYIKTVIDIERRICSSGAEWHADSEKILIEDGSKQSHLWGGGIEMMTGIIDYNSFINLRVNQNNTSHEIQDPNTRKNYEELTRYFFGEFLGEIKS